MKNVYALIDCNNFYVSCERVFNPDLAGRSVIVLSNNDGCCVSRSNEAKALGIPMGVPFFKIKDLVKKHNITVFSSNYELYADMSNRVMQTLTHFSPEIEFYSIDEAFLHLNYTQQNYRELGKQIQATIKQHTGIPVSVGVGTTKTLAKAANEIAKKYDSFAGVLNLVDRPKTEQQEYLQLLPVADVWGIGRQYTKKLKQRGITTAAKLAAANKQAMRELLTVTGMRTVSELNGTSCLPLETITPPKKGICSSRSFGSYVTSLAELKKSLATYIDRACTKLREDGSVSRYVTIFVHSNKFNKTHKQQHQAVTVSLTVPSQYPPDFYAVAIPKVAEIYQEGIKYAKAGVYLSGITSEHAVQQHLFAQGRNERISHGTSMSATIDTLRKQYGKDIIQFGQMGLQKNWRIRREHLSKRYTTKLDEVMVAR